MNENIQFPEEDVLVIRPSLIKICQGNRPAAKLLSALLNLPSVEIDNCTVRIICNQDELIAVLIDEFSDRTLRDRAIPCVVQLGYVEVERSNYIVHLCKIQDALDRLSTVPISRLDRSPRPTPVIKIWRAAVLHRDGYVCRRCGTTAYLVAHHIAPWSTHPSKRLNVANGVTLCRDCHNWVESKDNTAKEFLSDDRGEVEG